MTEKKQSKDDNVSTNWSAEEKAAMKERAKELKAAKSDADNELAVMEKIAEMPDEDKVIATKLHNMIHEKFPNLRAKTWYGMPAYYLEGKVLVFFQSGQRFGSRYSTLGFNDTAKLDDGSFWATSFALKSLDEKIEGQIQDLITKAIG